MILIFIPTFGICGQGLLLLKLKKDESAEKTTFSVSLFFSHGTAVNIDCRCSSVCKRHLGYCRSQLSNSFLWSGQTCNIAYYIFGIVTVTNRKWSAMCSQRSNRVPGSRHDASTHITHQAILLPSGHSRWWLDWLFHCAMMLSLG